MPGSVPAHPGLMDVGRGSFTHSRVPPGIRPPTRPGSGWRDGETSLSYRPLLASVSQCKVKVYLFLTEKLYYLYNVYDVPYTTL